MAFRAALSRPLSGTFRSRPLLGVPIRPCQEERLIVRTPARRSVAPLERHGLALTKPRLSDLFVGATVLGYDGDACQASRPVLGEHGFDLVKVIEDAEIRACIENHQPGHVADCSELNCGFAHCIEEPLRLVFVVIGRAARSR